VKPGNLLIISPLISVNAPQPARFRELISRWASHFDITVLSFNTGREDIISQMGATPALIEFSAAGRLLIGSRLKRSGNQKQGAVPGSAGHGSGFRSLLKKIHINMLFFPDIFIVEYLRIKRHLFDLVEKLQPETVIISTAPFTLMLLAGPLKRRFPEIRVVVDTGDPFRGDSSSYSRRLLHRLFAGKLERECLTVTDLLVVPTEILKKHYLMSYEDILTERKVQVIEIGISDIFNQIPNGRTDRIPPIRIVNAGRFYKSLRDPSELYKAVCQFPIGEVILKVFGNLQDKYKPPISDPRFFAGGAISFKQLAHEYEQSDLVIFLDNASGVQVPGKLYELLAVNRPVLYIYQDSAAPSYDLVKGQDGVVMVQNNHRDIAAGITQIMKMKPGQKYTRGSDKYSYDSLAERYRALLEDPDVLTHSPDL
jgi:hypothetical protein